VRFLVLIKRRFRTRILLERWTGAELDRRGILELICSASRGLAFWSAIVHGACYVNRARGEWMGLWDLARYFAMLGIQIYSKLQKSRILFVSP
jgi:hypothetical protein